MTKHAFDKYSLIVSCFTTLKQTYPFFRLSVDPTIFFAVHERCKKQKNCWNIFEIKAKTNKTELKYHQ